MSDLLSHSLAAYIVRARPSASRRAVVLFVTGTVLPDAASHVPNFGMRVMNLLTGFEFPKWFDHAFYMFHSPIPVAAFCWFLALWVPGSGLPGSPRREVFSNLTLGAWLHLALDIVQRHVSPITYFPFYPFSQFTGELKWMWTEHSIYAIPLLLLIAAWVARRRRR